MARTKERIRKVLLLWTLVFTTFTTHSAFQSDTLRLNFRRSEADAYADPGFSFSLLNDFESNALRLNYADSPQFAAKHYDDSYWDIDSSREVYGAKAQQVYWYRFKIAVDTAFRVRPFVPLLDGEGAYEMYVDGRLTAKVGVIPDQENREGHYEYFNANPVILSLPDSGVYTIALRYKSNPSIGIDGVRSFRIHTEDAHFFFRNRHVGALVSGVLLMGIGSVFLALFIVHFLFFIFYKKEKANIFFAIFTLSVALILFSSYAYFNAEGMALDGFYVLTMNFVPIVSCFSLSAFTTFIFSKNRTIFNIIIAVSLIALFVALLDHFAVISFSAEVIWLLLALSLLYTVVMIIRSIVQRQPGSLVLGSGVLYFCLFLIFLVVYIIVYKGMKVNNLLVVLMVTAIFAIPISISAYLAWRFSTTSRSLGQQLKTVEILSTEKQQLLQSQNEQLEKLVLKRTEELQNEKHKSDELLLNILPASIAEELKTKGSARAQYFEQVTVLFTDFVNFTQISERLGVEELVAELNINFTAFDGIMEKYGLEKIKTIGDAYLAVSGLPLGNDRHADNSVKAALEILEFVEQRKTEVPYGLDIRIGIHSGTVIAGIIGVKKFAYDIWGDTVNIAARMEQSSTAGRINISAATYSLVKDIFNCEYRGKIDAKHKGELDMYFVNGRK